MEAPVFLIESHPMGTAHQPWKDKDENTLLHRFGPSTILEGIFDKLNNFVGVSSFQLSKRLISKRCPFCAKVHEKDKFKAEVHFDCCNRRTKRGLMLCSNLLFRMLNPKKED